MKQRKIIRISGYDYTSPGYYFVTICTKDRMHYFGNIDNGEMILNDLGQYTTQHWSQISNYYPHVETDTFVCMPNHIHGILIIRSQNSHPQKKQFQPMSGSLGAIIRGFKTGITKYANQNDIPFARQGRYHDHVIRDQGSYERIREYIYYNPINRVDDCYS